MASLPEAHPTQETSKIPKTSPKVDLHGQLQFSHKGAPAFDDPLTSADESKLDALNSFSFRRVRLGADARLYGFKTRIKLDMSQGQFTLLSAWAQRSLPLGFKLRLGQHKRHLSMDYLVSSSHLRLIERSLASDEAGDGRDLGLSLSRALWSKRIQATLAVFNGNGSNTLSNDNDALRYETRLSLHPLGKYNLKKPKIGKKLKILLSGAFDLTQTNSVREAAPPGKASTGGDRYVLTRRDRKWVASAVFAAQFQGIEFRGEYFRKQRSPIDAEDPERVTLGVSDEAHRALLKPYKRSEEGGYAQLAWQLPWMRELELTTRYGLWVHDPQKQTHRISAVFGWRPYGDRVKLQTGWRQTRALLKGSATTTTWLWTTQLQLLY